MAPLTYGVTCLYFLCNLQICYFTVREMFRERKMSKGLCLQISTSLLSSFFAAFISLPIDLVKTRYQVKQSGLKQQEIFEDILHRKGIWYFWKGFLPYYVRLATHTIISLILVDRLYQISNFKD